MVALFIAKAHTIFEVVPSLAATIVRETTKVFGPAEAPHLTLTNCAGADQDTNI